MAYHLDETTRRAHKQRNLMHTALLLAGLGLLLLVPAYLVWGVGGALVAAGIVGVVVLAGPRVPPMMVMKMYAAREVAPNSDHPLNRILDQLAQRAELEARPRLFIIPSRTLNAFATGSADTSAIALTEGLVRKLDLRELAAVMAHEVSHIRNNDLLVMGIADVVSRCTQAMSYAAAVLVAINIMGYLFQGEAAVSWLAIAILYLAPALSSLLQLGLSRSREYDADLEGAMLIGDPSWLASALSRLETYTGRVWEDLMFPVPGRHVPHPSVLRSHPSTADRIARLRQLDVRLAEPPIVVREGPVVSMVGAGPIAMRPRHRWPGIWY